MAIGKDSSETVIHKYCTPENEHCTHPKSGHTSLIVLEYGSYGGEPATKVLLIPHTGMVDTVYYFAYYIPRCVVRPPHQQATF